MEFFAKMMKKQETLIKMEKLIKILNYIHSETYF